MGQVRTGHRVERVEERAGSVDVVSRTAGQSMTEHFDRVVIAAGGLNSPLVLQNSGLGGRETGRNFTDHPMGFVAKLWSRNAKRCLFAAARPKVPYTAPPRPC